MRTKLLLFPFFCLFLTAAKAQHEETVLGHHGLAFSGIWGGANSQIARFGNSNSYMSGGFIGLEFGRTLFVGYTHYDLSDNVNWDQLTKQPFKMRYNGLTLGYGFRNYRAIHPVINVDFAGGHVESTLNNETNTDNVFVVQPAAGVEFNVFRWFHLGLQGGYRFVTDSSLPGLSDEQLSGAFGQISLKFGWSWNPNKNCCPEKAAPKSAN